uniref:Uncharacterized protein n=1 Tax=Strigamia maritima TaxID=126957 RepID=T1IVU9_STRMM
MPFTQTQFCGVGSLHSGAITIAVWTLMDAVLTLLIPPTVFPSNVYPRLSRYPVSGDLEEYHEFHENSTRKPWHRGEYPEFPEKTWNPEVSEKTWNLEVPAKDPVTTEKPCIWYQEYPWCIQRAYTSGNSKFLLIRGARFIRAIIAFTAVISLVYAIAESEAAACWIWLITEIIIRIIEITEISFLIFVYVSTIYTLDNLFVDFIINCDLLLDRYMEFLLSIERNIRATPR